MVVWAQIAMAGAGALSSYLSAGKAEKAAQKRFEAEQKRLKEELEQSKYKRSGQLQKLERFTDTLKGQAGQRDVFMEQAVMAGTRRAVATETERQQGAAGLTGAGRIRSAQMVAGAQAQGLLAVESTRQQRERELNQLVSQNLAKAADITQAGYAVEAQTRSQISAARTNLMMAQEQASAQKTGALISGFAGMAAAGIEAFSTPATPATPATGTKEAGGIKPYVSPYATANRQMELNAVDTRVRGMAESYGYDPSTVGGSESSWWNPTSWW